MNRILLGFLCLFITSTAISQISIVEPLDSGVPVGWSSSGYFSNSTVAPCEGTSHVRHNLYSLSTTGFVETPNQVGASNGTDITVTYEWQTTEFSFGSGVGLSVDVEYSIDGGTNYLPVNSFTASTEESCTVFSETILGANVPNGSDFLIRITGNQTSGDFFNYIDNFSATQVALDPPNCDALLTSNTTAFPLMGTLTWSNATGIPTGYKLSIGTFSGGMDILAETDLGSMTSYDASSLGLSYSTTYYASIIPYNDNGDATGCTPEAFITEQAPPANDDCTGATSIACDDVLLGETTVNSSDNGDDTGCFVGAGVWYEFTGIDAVVTVTIQPAVGFDPELAVASSSDCVNFVNVDCEDGGGSGTAESITFTATVGTTYYFFVGHYTSATTFGDFDISVACDFCIPPTFSLANGTNNCPTGTEFNVDVDVTDLGSGTTVDITYDDGSGPQTVSGVGAVVTQIGPFAPGVNVDVTVADSGDGTCSASSSITTLGTCPALNIDCASATAIACDDSFAGETTIGSFDTGDAMGCFMGAGVWYEFTGVDAIVTLTVQPETGFDPEIAVASSADCTSFDNIDCEDTGGSGTSEEITFTAVAGTTYYFYVGHFSSSTVFGNFDISVTCDFCIPATFSLDNGTNNCPTGTEYNVDVIISDFGNATTLDVTYDDGSGPVTVPNVSGDISIGPFASGATVDVMAADSADGTCSTPSSSITTPIICPPANDDCATATSIACDDVLAGETTVGSTDNGDVTGCFVGAGVWYEFTGVHATVTVTVQPAVGFDPELAVASSSDCVNFDNIDCEDGGGSGTAESIVFTASVGTTYYFFVGHYSSATTFGDFDISVTCDLCVPATFSLVNGTNNCPIGTENNVDVIITDIGSATTLDVTYDDGSGPVTVPNVSGDIAIGPFAAGATVDVTAADSADGTCSSSTSSITTPTICPPVNDDVCSAEALTVDAPQVPGDNTLSTFEANEMAGSCWDSTLEDNSVWYYFVAPGSGLVEITTDFVTGLNDSQISLYTITDCNDLTTANEIACDEDGGFTGSGWMSYIETSGAPLTGGDTYYIQVDGYGAKVGGFEIQVNELPPANDECATSAVLAMNTTGSLIDQYFAAATGSGMGAEACDGSSTPTPSDVWYSINTDADGGNLIVIVEPGTNSDVVVAIYDDCMSAVPEQCVDLNGNGGIETINFQANIKNDKGNVSTTRDANYFVRIYEKLPSGEPFEIGAQGEALPIVLGSFEAVAEKRGNNVKWSTLSEINSDYVDVQSSPNGSTRWKSIGKVTTKGESNARVDYDLFDYNPFAVTYYRLNAVDKDGKEELSRVINVKREDVPGKMILSPNPANSLITLQTSSAKEEVGTITLIDMTGKIVKKVSASLIKGLNTINLDLVDLQSGLYLFSLQTEEGLQVEKFVKQ